MSLVKKIKTILFLLSFTTFIFAEKTQASLLIEPHLAYNLSGSGDAAAEVYDYSGPQYGLRLGFQYLGLMSGLDFTKSIYTLETKTLGTSSKADYDRNEFGVFLGYNLPVLLRVWGAYYFSGEAKNKQSGNKILGNSTELGIGFTGIPFLSLNLMYRMINNEKQVINGRTSAMAPKQDLNEFVLGLSIPLNL
jgi:hypothetical protein